MVDGPFAESQELVGGFYIVDVKSRKSADRVGAALPERDGLRRRPGDSGADGGIRHPPDLLDLVKTAAPTWSASLWNRR